MDIVLTSFFNHAVDQQRGVKWEADEQLIHPLAKSCKKLGIKLVVLNNCFEDGVRGGAEFVRVEPIYQPYFERWRSQLNYLNKHPEVKRLFMVDSTDVVAQYNPFHKGEMKPGIVYVGDELEVLGMDWIVEDGDYAPVRGYIKRNPNTLLLNCGVVGGSRKDLMDICNKITQMYVQTGKTAKTEMPIFNYVMRTQFDGRISRGRHVTTVFKQYEKGAGGWFRHK